MAWWIEKGGGRASLANGKKCLEMAHGGKVEVNSADGI